MRNQQLSLLADWATPAQPDDLTVDGFSHGRISRDDARLDLERRFGHLLDETDLFNRQLVSFQANKTEMLHSWVSYREGFSATLVERLMGEFGVAPGEVVCDPFAGSCTTLLTAKMLGFDAVGIELLPNCHLAWEAKSRVFDYDLAELRRVRGLLDQVRGEDLAWDAQQLAISEKAWARVIHRGIKPVLVFAHPQILTTLPRVVGYYRMLALVSQKSMLRIGLGVASYEDGSSCPPAEVAEALAQRLNRIISDLVEADAVVEPREFDLWRGMSAGSQAQGSWGNTKGDRAEAVVKSLLQRRIKESRTRQIRVQWRRVIIHSSRGGRA